MSSLLLFDFYHEVSMFSFTDIDRQHLVGIYNNFFSHKKDKADKIVHEIKATLIFND